MPDKVSLRATIEKRLEQFNIDKSVISEALNFAVQSPAEVTTRFLQGVARDSVHAGRPGFEAQVEAYRNNPTLPEARREMGLTLLADVILETKATTDVCITALRGLGQLPNGCEAVVGSIANQVHEFKNNFCAGVHMSVGENADATIPANLGRLMAEHIHVLSSLTVNPSSLTVTSPSAHVEVVPKLDLNSPPPSPATSGWLDAPQYGLGQPRDHTPTVQVVTPRA